MADRLPHIAILATGGTILSAGTSSTQLTGYRLSQTHVEDLLGALPELASLARITTKTVSHIDSSSMTSAVWADLVETIHALANDTDVDGFVITHGTDTMEETAYALHLALATDKPVVFTGAMRPASAISAEGPLNLLNAVRIAADPRAHHRGVLIAMNDAVFSAREAQKTDPTNVATFTSGAWGALALIAGDRVEWLRTPTHRHTTQSLFSGLNLRDLPRVDMVMSHTDDDGVMIEAAIHAGAKGIIHLGTGNGSIHDNALPALFAAAKKGVVVVRASRVATGVVVNGLSEWQDAGFIPSGSLSAAKARILLQFALKKGLPHAATLACFSDH